MDVADARNVEIVRLDRRRRRHGPGRQAQVLQHRLERRAIGVRDDDRAGAELPAVQLEVVFGGQHLHVGVLEAERHEVVVGRVLDDQRAPVPSMPPAALTAPATSVIGCVEHALSVTGVIFTLRMYWNVQPVSS